MGMNKITCIVPFYNEGRRVLKVLNTLDKVKNIDEIICVDDGSQDTTYKKIIKKFPKIKIIRHEKNLGKVAAVKSGYHASANDMIFLIDADLKNLQKNELEKAIKDFKNNKKIKMLILRRKNPLFSLTDTILSGERILYKKDLEKILKKHIKNYQLEVAINEYMIENNKLSAWKKYSANNTYKVFKKNFFEGLKNEIKMSQEIIDYIGYPGYVKQLISFPKIQIK
ncbi:glycosyltransferase [Candidatus Peregrinibacteria bacterium]|nr:glycosyltransferase [Candidatus Peregrinibacteria bacterium]